MIVGPGVRDAAAAQRLIRRLDSAAGLPVDNVTALAEDPAGFLWIGTVGGICRYDGVSVRRWAERAIYAEVRKLAVTADGSVLAAIHDGRVMRVVGDDAFPVAGPDGRTLGEVKDLLVDRRTGAVWVVSGRALLRWRPGGTWDEPMRDAAAGERVRHVGAGRDGSMLVVMDSGVWRLAAAGGAERLAVLEQVVDAVDLPGADKGVIAAVWGGRLVEIRPDGTLLERLKLSARAISLAVRGDTVWAAFDHVLAAVRAGRAVEILGASEGILSGGPMLVDREGSLWLGTFSGLLQFPEPETRSYGDRDGLPSPHTRFLARDEEGLWVATWGGLGLLSETDGLLHGTKLESSEPRLRGRMCVDGDGAWWSDVGGRIVERRGRAFAFYGEPSDLLGSCRTAPDGTVWIYLGARRGRLYRTARAPAGAATAGAPALVAELELPGEDDPGPPLLEDRAGRFWIAPGERLCRTDAAVLRGLAGAALPATRWTCDALPGALFVSDLQETPAGTPWAATGRAGLWRWTGARWEPLPGSRAFPSPVAYGISPSPTGGVWVTSAGAALRVEERPDLPDGWRVLERLHHWHGLLTTYCDDLIEDEDGSLWLATATGVQHLPAAVRRAPIEPPPVVLVEARVDGEVLAVDRALELPFRRNRLELHFAALTFRDPTLLRYRFRLSSDAGWTDVVGRPVLQLVDLAPGAYRAEVVASLDGARWTPAPAGLSFVVLRPWYLEPWAVASLALAVAALLYAAYRMRLASLLRLERQRARIAMDLHDEMGSGLGSIALLGSMAADGDVPDGERRSHAARIAETATELGRALGDIVWSLRARSGTLQALADQLLARGGALFPGGGADLVADLPEAWPPLQLTLPVRRNLQLIALEALHNAARHASAKRVVLGLAPAGLRRWRLWVHDDGSGFDVAAADAGAEARATGGLGLGSMRKRAEEIGAHLGVDSRPGGGTRVTVTFRPTAEDVAAPPRRAHGRAREIT
ncbi:MAG TPA: two-component regulator propeller domain-containing protein [Myxococcota bacterium]|nr:two-component regulator propeller domain-containing protein [Myxococcota bacterium]